MLNWNVDEDRFKEEDPEGYKLWRITQLINYGCDNEKLNRREIKEAWDKIKENIDPYKRRLLEYLIWDKLYLLPIDMTFSDIVRMNQENFQKKRKKFIKKLYDFLQDSN